MKQEMGNWFMELKSEKSIEKNHRKRLGGGEYWLTKSRESFIVFIAPLTVGD